MVFCQHRTELEQGQIEFGSKLRAHKFEQLPSILKCVFSNPLKYVSISKEKKYEVFFFYYEVSPRHCITTYGTPCVELWCIALSACCQWIWCQYPTPQKQFILYSYSIYCPWLYAFQIHLPSITKGTARSKPEKLSAEKYAIPKFLNFWTHRRVCSESLESWGGWEAQKEISRLIQTYGRHEDVGEWEKEGKDTQNKRPCRRVHSLPTSWKTCHGHLPFKCDDI